MPTIDFLAAAARHRHDARRLLDERRYDNALYLSGYVAECALKAVVARTGGDPKTFGHELVKLHGEGLELAFVASAASTRYRPPERAVEFLSSRWSSELRYRRSGACPQAVQAALDHAEAVWISTVGQMYLDGFLPDWIDA